MRCPNCGTQNPSTSKFCSECGAPLVAPAPPPAPAPQSAPAQPVAVTSPSPRRDTPIDPTELPPTHPEWRMSSAGPLPEPPRRRIWLWALVAIGLCVFIYLMMMLTNSVISNAVGQ